MVATSDLVTTFGEVRFLPRAPIPALAIPGRPFFLCGRQPTAKKKPCYEANTSKAPPIKIAKKNRPAATCIRQPADANSNKRAVSLASTKKSNRITAIISRKIMTGWRPVPRWRDPMARQLTRTCAPCPPIGVALFRCTAGRGTARHGGGRARRRRSWPRPRGSRRCRSRAPPRRNRQA